MPSSPVRDAFRARRGFFTAVAVATLTVAAGHPLADAVRLGHWSERHDERKLAWLQRSGEPPEVLVLGSSRAKFAFVARDLEARLSASAGRRVSAFNAAQGDTGALEASWFLGEIVRSNGCPRLVALDLNAEGMNAASERIETSLRLYLPPSRWLATLPRLDTWRRLEAYLTGLATGWQHLLHAVAEPPTSDSSRAEAAEIERCRGSVYGPPEVDCQIDRSPDMSGWGAARERRKLSRYRRRLREYYRFEDFEIGGLPAHGLERVAELCRRCGADLVVVTLPNRFPWEDWGWADETEATRSYAESFAERHGATHLDLSGLAGELEAHHFYDHGHLSRRGAYRVTRELAAAAARRLED